MSTSYNEPSTAIFGPRQRGVPTAHACAVGCERSGPVVIRKRRATRALTENSSRAARPLHLKTLSALGTMSAAAIVLSTGLAHPADPAPPDGAKLFEAACASCHNGDDPR